MQKIIILALLCAATLAAQDKIDTACGDGYVKTTGVCQKCHVTCKTCIGPKSDQCKACYVSAPTAVIAAIADATVGGSCECPSPKAIGSTDATPTVVCQATSGTFDAALTTAHCDTVFATGGQQYYKSADKYCVPCDAACNHCTGAGAAACHADTDSCWGGIAAAPDCGAAYTAASTGWISGSQFQVVLLNGVEGYFANADERQYEVCGAGCLECTSATACTKCTGSYTASATTGKCTCEDGSWESEDKQTCTACPTGCLTCTSDTVCATCKASDGTSEAWVLSSSLCVEPSSSVEEEKVETEADANTAANIKPPTTCEATLIGCTACDAADKAKCTACAEKYFQKLNATTNSCDCDATHARNPDGGCGTKCTATCATGEMCKVDAAAKQTCSAAGTSTSTNGLLLTAASMIFAVILA